MQIIQFRSLAIFPILIWYKGLFLLFFGPRLRKEREELLDSRGGERNLPLTPI